MERVVRVADGVAFGVVGTMVVWARLWGLTGSWHRLSWTPRLVGSSGRGGGGWGNG